MTWTYKPPSVFTCRQCSRSAQFEASVSLSSPGKSVMITLHACKNHRDPEFNWKRITPKERIVPCK